MYNILGAGGNNIDDESTVPTITQTAAAATTGSMLANTYATSAPVPTDPQIALAMNSLAANQQALYEHLATLSQQMSAMSFNTKPPTPQCTFTAPHLTPFNVPPIHQLSIPAPPLSMKGVSTIYKEVEAQGDVGADVDSIGLVEHALLLQITWLLAVVGSMVAWVITTCSHKRVIFRL